MKNSNLQIQYFDHLRDKILVTLYSDDNQSFQNVFSELKTSLSSNLDLSENDLKSLYQINVIIKKFKKNNACLYLNKILKTTARNEIINQETIEYDTWKNRIGIDEKTLKILFSTTANFQLSTGCSNYCKRCNEWSLPGVRRNFSYNAIIKIIKNLSEQNNNKYALYSASDPLDWQNNNKNITHLMESLSKKNLIPKFGLLTKIPKGKEYIFKKLIQKGTDISVSITSLNRERIKRIENDLSITVHKQHDTDDLLIPSGRDEDFDSIKSSITDSYGTEITPDGAFIVLPTFTSALNPTGQKRIPVNKDTKFFIKKMVESKGLKFDYFEHLNVIDLQNKQYTLGYLLDSQIENLLLDTGDYNITQPGMISLKEYFETFKPKAVKIRSGMISTVKKNLNAEYSGKEYKEKLKAYKNFCDQNHVTKMKYQLFTNLLKSIKEYLKKNNAKKLIICHLRKKENICFNCNELNNISKILIFLQKPASDTFFLFRHLTLRLSENPEDKLVAELLNT